MREILFRGKRVDNKEWVEGCYVRSVVDDSVFAYIISSIAGEAVQVYSNTVGQYTGLDDRNGKKIFEGDIIHYDLRGEYYGPDYYRHSVGPVIFSDQCFMPLTFCVLDTLIVSGNIYDNPELLEEEK